MSALLPKATCVALAPHEIPNETRFHAKAPSQSVTILEAPDNWLKHIEADNRERSTLDQYRQHVRLHIVPELGSIKLASLNATLVEAFRDKLLAKPKCRAHWRGRC